MVMRSPNCRNSSGDYTPITDPVTIEFQGNGTNITRVYFTIPLNDVVPADTDCSSGEEAVTHEVVCGWYDETTSQWATAGCRCVSASFLFSLFSLRFCLFLTLYLSRISMLSVAEG